MIKNTKILAKYLEQAMFQGEQAMMNLTWKNHTYAPDTQGSLILQSLKKCS